MENIKKQVEALIVYKGETVDALKAEYQSLVCRVNNGITKMKESTVFTENEIAHIQTFAKELLMERFASAKEALINSIRDSFEF